MSTTNAPTNPEQGNDDAYINGSSIAAFYAESVILITGATGFLGKVLVAKLLRACPRLAMIFVLIRPRKNQTVEQRFNNLLEDFVFNEIRSTNLLSKIHPVKGDVALPDLGLSPEDKSILTERVNIIFHSAATVRFNKSIKVAVNLNTKGTDRMVELAKSMKNLISFIHVSTAYSNSDRRDIDEMVYPMNVKPSTVIDMCEGLDEETLNMLEKRILNTHPNTYTFTKKLAEHIILEKGKGMPIAIVRPSIIGAAEKEPQPGWVDNIFGLTAPIMEIGRGSVASIVANTEQIPDVIPVDRVVDMLICAAWHNTVQYSDTIKVYNCTNSAPSVGWGRLNEFVKQYSIESPSMHIMWYPCTTMRTNRFIHNLLTFTLQLFPAFLTDIYLRLKGDKPRALKFATRVHQMMSSTEYFRTHEWNFHQDNLLDLDKKVKLLKDSDNFIVTSKNVDWPSYIRNYVSGIRTFVLNDPPKTLEKARSKLHVYYWLHRLSQLFSILVVLLMIVRICH